MAEAPAELASLVELRSDLLEALAKLDAEHAAGEIDDIDHQTLRDDLTRRTAEVLRRIEAARATDGRGSAGDATAVDAGPRSTRSVAAEPAPSVADASRRTTLIWVAVVIGFALLAGVLVVQGSGQRGSTDLSSGDIRQTSRDLLLVAREQWATGRAEEALVTYEEVLAVAPTNTEALTYRAWVGRTILGTISDEEALELLSDAVAIDPDYADARVFRAIILRDVGRPVEALADVQAVPDDGVPEFMVELVASLADELRAQVAALGPATEAISEAFELFAQGDPVAALAVIDEAMADEPDDPGLLATRGIILAQVAVQSSGEDRAVLEERAISSLDRAVQLDPDEPLWLVRRAEAHLVMGRTDDARSDVEALVAMELPSVLVPTVEALEAQVR